MTDTDTGTRHERPVFFGGVDCWSNRHAAALVAYADAQAEATRHPHSEPHAQAVRDRYAEIGGIEQAMAADIYLMLRKGDEACGGGLKRDLAKLVGEMVEQVLNEFRNDIQSIAEAVLALERRRDRA